MHELIAIGAETSLTGARHVLLKQAESARRRNIAVILNGFGPRKS
jgi:hypothetical protein